uniref:Uncharacterized protein n=1 Tax=Picornavirales sp. TaxID=1955153 RepID=A0A6M3YNS7_9VIRU|nr:MAG: hypothetical protein 2 [Picornavirales sp.]
MQSIWSIESDLSEQDGKRRILERAHALRSNLIAQCRTPDVVYGRRTNGAPRPDICKTHPVEPSIGALSADLASLQLSGPVHHSQGGTTRRLLGTLSSPRGILSGKRREYCPSEAVCARDHKFDPTERAVAAVFDRTTGGGHLPPNRRSGPRRSPSPTARFNRASAAYPPGIATAGGGSAGSREHSPRRAILGGSDIQCPADNRHLSRTERGRSGSTSSEDSGESLRVPHCNQFRRRVERRRRPSSSPDSAPRNRTPNVPRVKRTSDSRGVRWTSGSSCSSRGSCDASSELRTNQYSNRGHRDRPEWRDQFPRGEHNSSNELPAYINPRAIDFCNLDSVRAQSQRTQFNQGLSNREVADARSFLNFERRLLRKMSDRLPIMWRALWDEYKITTSHRVRLMRLHCQERDRSISNDVTATHPTTQLSVCSTCGSVRQHSGRSSWTNCECARNAWPKTWGGCRSYGTKK